MKRDNWIGFLPYYLLALIVFISIAAGADSAVTALAQNTPVLRSRVIIIDAGHGGVDGGATSCTGILEKQLNLEISLRLNELCRLLGYQTVMIRTEDISIHTQGDTIAAKKISDLRERTRIVNETDNALLVSIHQNTFSDSRYGGAQVFYPKSEESHLLARTLQSAFAKYLNPGSNRKAKKSAGVYLMEHIEKPGLLIECGFLSNPEEEAKLRSDAYQKKLSAVIAVTLANCLSNT